MVVIVVHAEGPGDLGQPAPWVAPRDSLSDDDLGPVHELVRRALEVDARLPAAAIDFREPLRTRAGHRAHGSELLSRRVLDDLFGAWRLGEERPVIVVLVDADGQSAEARAEVIRDAIANSRLRGAVGVAVQELEAWLVSDPAALEQVLGKGHPSPAAAERCDRGRRGSS